MNHGMTKKLFDHYLSQANIVNKNKGNFMNIKNLFVEKYNKAIVTGGTGFIGSHIVEELIELGIDVVCVDDGSAGKVENVSAHFDKTNFQYFECDIVDYNKLKTIFNNVDIVFHNAASKKNICLKDPRRDLDVNSKGTFNLLELSRDNGVAKFVHASTGSVYGEAQFFPQTENHPFNPVSYYGVSKLAGERYVQLFNHLYNLDTSILRYFHVYGPRQEHNEFGGVVSIFIRNMIRDENPTIFGDGTQERTFTYVKDLVKANLLVAIKDEANGEDYNCASGIAVTINELCFEVIKLFEKEGKLKPKYEDWLIGDIKKFDVSNKKIIELGLSFEKDFFKMLNYTIQEMKKYLK